MPCTPYGIDQRGTAPFPGEFTLPGGNTIGPVPGTNGQGLSDYRAGYVPSNFNQYLTDHPDIDRYGFFAKGKYELLPALTVYTELLYNRSDSRIQVAPAPFDSLYTAPLLIPVGNPYNPFGVSLATAQTTGSLPTACWRLATPSSTSLPTSTGPCLARWSSCRWVSASTLPGSTASRTFTAWDRILILPRF